MTSKIWKPDPAFYIYVAHQMKFAPANCIVVEDSITGVEAGVKAGMKVFWYQPHFIPGFVNPFSTSKLVIIHSIKELLNHLPFCN